MAEVSELLAAEIEAAAKAVCVARGGEPTTLHQIHIFTGEEPFDHQDAQGRRYVYAWRGQVEYVTAALAAAAKARTPTPVTEDWVMVPKAALDWLNGEATDPAGMEFGEFTEDYPKPAGAFWWRKVFRQICEFYAAQRPPLSASPSPPKADGPGEDAWQPIETAPKDGASIDLWVTEKYRAYRVPDAWWGDEDMWTTGGGHSVEGFFDATTGIPLIRAVYWRPLPVSPSIKREA